MVAKRYVPVPLIRGSTSSMGFLLVFYSRPSRCPKCTVFELGAWNRQTDRQTERERRVAALLNAPFNNFNNLKL